jgi:NAD(P)-dependent dehydrogenase (short-subunit alcohol dehydrogenase family)
MAQEGADVILVDICKQATAIDYPAATADDLAETVRQVQELDRRVVSAQADVRDLPALEQLVARGVDDSAGSTSSWPTPGLSPGDDCGR